MKPPRVCIFTETYYPVIGGGETQAQILAEGLAARGHSVLVLTRRSDPSLPASERIANIPVYRVAPAGKGRHKKWALLLTTLPTLFKLHSSFDILFVSGFRLIGLPALVASKLFKKICVFKADSQGEMSGEYFNNGLQNVGLSRAGLLIRLFLALRNRIFRLADAFCAISPGIEAELRTCGIPKHKIWEIPNGVDSERFSPVDSEQKRRLREKLNIQPAAFVVIYTGRLVSYKGLPLLLRVWKDIQLKYPATQLILVGAGGLDMHNCEDELRRYVQEQNLEQSVLFTGNVRNVPEYLQAADLFVFPSEDDAFPSSLVEAMACALPVVTTPVGAIPTVVAAGQNGMLVSPRDYQSLYQAMETLMVDRALSARLAQAGLETTRSRYSAEAITEKYRALFSALAEK